MTENREINNLLEKLSLVFERQSRNRNSLPEDVVIHTLSKVILTLAQVNDRPRSTSS
jgi:hypothetical protein